MPRETQQVITYNRPWIPPFEAEIIPPKKDGSPVLEIKFSPHLPPVKAEFFLDQKGNLSEKIKLTQSISATVKYGHSNGDGYQSPVSLTLETTHRQYPDIDLKTIDRTAETTFNTTDGKQHVTVFKTHPNMNPSAMFGGTADFSGRFNLGNEQDKSISVYFEEMKAGFTIPSLLNNEGLGERIENGTVPFRHQIFVVPNEKFLTQEVTGKPIESIPLVIGERFNTTKSNELPKLVALSQRLGHAKVVCDMAQQALGNTEELPGSLAMQPDDFTAYFVPTPDTINRVEHGINRYILPENGFRGWCYAPEEGYGIGKLKDDTKKMLTVLATNPRLIYEVMENAGRGLIVYSDTKPEAGYLSLLAKMSGINLRVITKAYSVFNRKQHFGEEHGGKQIDTVIDHAHQAFQDSSKIMTGLGEDPEAPDAVKFMHDKMTASFNDGIILYTTDGLSADVPEHYGTSPVVAIPLAFMGRTPDKIYKGLDARQRLSREITNQQSTNVSSELIDRIASSDQESQIGIVAFQLGTSSNLYADEAIDLMIQTAQQMPESAFILTGYKQRLRYLAEIGRILNLPETQFNQYELTSLENGVKLEELPANLSAKLIAIENQLPPNVIVMGMRRDVAKINAAVNVLVSTSTIGNVLDAVRSETALITIGPDTITLNEGEKIAKITQVKKNGQARDDIAVMAETARERAGDLLMVARAYEIDGIPPDQAVLPIALKPNIDDAVNKIEFALTHQVEMGQALRHIKYIHAEELLDILLQIRNGADAEKIRNMISQRYSDFSPRYIADMTADLTELQNHYNS